MVAKCRMPLVQLLSDCLASLKMLPRELKIKCENYRNLARQDDNIDLTNEKT